MSASKCVCYVSCILAADASIIIPQTLQFFGGILLVWVLVTLPSANVLPINKNKLTIAKMLSPFAFTVLFTSSKRIYFYHSHMAYLYVICEW